MDQIYVAVTAFFLFVALIIVYLARPDGSADAGDLDPGYEE